MAFYEGYRKIRRFPSAIHQLVGEYTSQGRLHELLSKYFLEKRYDRGTFAGWLGYETKPIPKIDLSNLQTISYLVFSVFLYLHSTQMMIT